MAKESLVVKCARPQRYKTRQYNRCSRCGRLRGYYREFGVGSICLLELSHEGVIPGLTMSSW